MKKLSTELSSRSWIPEMDMGRHHRARIGFILMSTDLAAEDDYFKMAPEGVGVHITRLKTEDTTTKETLRQHLKHMEEAASRLQPDARPNVVSYCCTSGSIVNGEQQVFGAIQRGAPWATPTSIVTGVVDALHALNVQKLVVGTPYLDEINQAEAEFLHQKGFEVLDIQGLNLRTGVEFGRVTPDYWQKFALTLDQPDADAIFLSCSGVRALEVVENLEHLTGKPVITSNQALFWSCLRLAGVPDRLAGFGRLFDISNLPSRTD